MKLYFDIGNTNIKLNFLDGEEQYFSFKTKNKTHTPDSFYGLMPKKVKESKIEKVFIVSVVPKVTSLVARTIEKYMKIKPIILQFPIKTGMKMKATDPKSIGADLIALAVLSAEKSKNSIMINLGTSTTIMHVVNNEFLGVIIAPGIYASFESLINNAAKLPEISLEPTKKVLGNNTEECLSIGVLKGHIHMLRGFIREIDTEADVFISGGHSELIKDYINATFIKEATIEGMKVLEKLNES